MTLTVVCSFEDGDLPSSWFRLYQRLKLAVTRAGIDADVRLAALAEIGDDVDVVVVPPDVEAGATAVHASGKVVVGLGQKDAAGLKELVASLQSMGAGPAPEGTPFAHHKGFRLMATRVASAVSGTR
jgi:hypothetical protein